MTALVVSLSFIECSVVSSLLYVYVCLCVYVWFVCWGWMLKEGCASMLYVYVSVAICKWYFRFYRHIQWLTQVSRYRLVYTLYLYYEYTSMKINTFSTKLGSCYWTHFTETSLAMQEQGLKLIHWWRPEWIIIESHTTFYICQLFCNTKILYQGI